MSTCLHVDSLRPSGLLVVALSYAAVLLVPAAAYSQGTLSNSFETGLEGFVPNGIGVSISQDTIGATDGEHSLKIDLVQGATYAGALNQTPDPSVFGDPPGIDFMSLDLTVTEVNPPETNFVDIFPVVFGASQPDPSQQQGLEISFQANLISIRDLPVGTHHLVFNLDMGIHPLLFEFATFNEIFGVVGSGPNDIIPSGWQIIVNKPATSAWTGYVDNIRFGLFSEMTPGDFDNDGDIDGHDYLVWQRGETDPLLSAAALSDWQAGYGTRAISASLASVPEPSSGLLVAVLALLGVCRPQGSRNFWRQLS